MTSFIAMPVKLPSGNDQFKYGIGMFKRKTGQLD
jgi:hypothetical protein